MASNVYFSDFSTRGGLSQLEKLEKLITKAGIDTIDFKEKYVAVKVHFGEWGNMAFLRQQYARVVCDHIKKLGGKPFLTDCNTLYPGYRHNAVDHLDCAYRNGYNPLCTGVQTIIADGLRGNDERLIAVDGGEYVKLAKIGAAVADADIIVSLTHFKGHDNTGFGGVLKNIGMGCGSKGGKMEMHSAGTPKVNTEQCVGCGSCARNCLNDGVRVVNGKAVIDENKCLGCGHCFAYCPKGAIGCKWDEANPTLTRKVAEYAKAVLDGKPAFHVSFLKDVSPLCDCDSCNDIPLIPDVGMFAGFDPVAIDEVCARMANEQKVNPASKAAKLFGNDKKDIFKALYPTSDWQAGLEHAEKLGLGSRDYELIKV